MAEFTISADEIAASLKAHVASFTPSLEAAQVGRVLEVGDGIVRVAGLPETSVNELLEFEGGVLGLALNLDEESIGQRLIALSDFTGRKLEWTDSAGLRQVHRKTLSKEDIKKMIRRAYG